MELTNKELNLVILGMEELMAHLKDNGIRDTLDESQNRERYYDAWEIADKAVAELRNRSKQLQK